MICREFSDDIEFAFVEEQEIDPLKQKDVLVGYAEAGAITLNQLREKIGEQADPNPAANQLMVRTPRGYVPIGTPAVDDTEGDADDVEDENEVVKLLQKKLSGIVMMPPENWPPVKRFSLNGTTFLPNLAMGGRLIVFSEQHARELEASEGWARKSTFAAPASPPTTDFGST